MLKKTCVTVSLVILTVLLLAGSTQAVVIGANKGVVDFNNVLKNGYAQELVTLTTDSDYEISVTMEPEGEIAQWVRFDPPTQPFYITKDKPYTLAVIIEPPGDTQIKRYSGSVRFLTGALSGTQGQFGTAVRTAINVRLQAQITGQQIVSCALSQFAMDDVEEGYPLEVEAVITNGGNVRINPEIVMDFWNQDQTKLVQTLSFTAEKQILPTTQDRIFKQLKHNLSIGQYWVTVKTPLCGDTGGTFITMSVIERGGISDKGELISITNNPWVKVGDIIPIDANFKNLGSRVVSAKFKGTVSSADNIFKIIDTDPVDVMPGETQSLRTYFNPLQEGQYIVTGRVLYNKKLTFEKSSVINVNAAGAPPLTRGLGLTTILAISLLLIAAILVVLIIRKKRSHRR